MAEHEWYREDNIGGGSFGNVEKWTNNRSGESVAVKIPNKKFNSNPADEDAWQKEINQLQAVSHPNVVSALPLPLDIQRQMNSRLPILCMQYCGGGSLRDLLRLPANRRGLPSRTALDVFRDVGAGVEYLHRLKIMHRDLKPENIVLEPATPDVSSLRDPDNCRPGVVYKLIDLGYAKNLEEHSLATSFVGTQPYLPPEMFIAKGSYSYPAEYWSFGTLIFECFAGKRPFFFNNQTTGIATWYGELTKKKDNHIYGILEVSGVRFYSTFPESCSLRGPYKTALETWLMLVLNFDDSKRGGYRRDARSKCFELLDEIVNMQVVNVFYVPTCTTFTYSIDDVGNSIAHLQQFLARDLGIAPGDQILLSGTGQNVTDHESVSRSVRDMSAGNYWLFLMPAPQLFSLPRPKTRVDGVVEIVLKDPDALLPREKRKEAYERCIHLAHQMFRSSQRLMQAQKASLLGVMRSSLAHEQQSRRAVHDAQRFINFSDFIRHNAADHLEKLRSMMPGLPGSMRHAAAAYESELLNQCDVLQAWEKEEFDLESHSASVHEVKEKVRSLQRAPAIVLPQCDESFERHLQDAESLLLEVRGDSDRTAASTLPMSRVLNACSSDFGRIVDSVRDHWKGMLLCHQTCMERIAAARALSDAVAGRLVELNAMRKRHLHVWNFVSQLSVNLSRRLDDDTGSGTNSIDGVVDQLGHLQPSVPSITNSVSSGAGSGTVRELTEFLDEKLIMESNASSGDCLLRENEALFTRFGGNQRDPMSGAQ